MNFIIIKVFIEYSLCRILVTLSIYLLKILIFSLKIVPYDY